jgi:hypothetical protein
LPYHSWIESGYKPNIFERIGILSTETCNAKGIATPKISQGFCHGWIFRIEVSNETADNAFSISKYERRRRKKNKLSQISKIFSNLLLQELKVTSTVVANANEKIYHKAFLANWEPQLKIIF